MSVIQPVPTSHHALTLYRPHNADGRWIVQLAATPGFETNWHCGQFNGEIQMTRPILTALRDALIRELADEPPPMPVPSMDADSVPVGFPHLLAGEPADEPTRVVRMTTREGMT